MSPDTDRIQVPTNGRGPHPAPPNPGPPVAGPSAPSDVLSSTPSNLELSVAFTPKQIAVGFGILASLLLLLAGLARRRAQGDRGTREPRDGG